MTRKYMRKSRMIAIRRITTTLFVVLTAAGVLVALVALPLMAAGVINVTRQTSSAMSPAVLNGSLVVSMRTPTETIDTNSVIVVNGGPNLNGEGAAVVSRVTTKTEIPGGALFQTKGDNNVLPDSWSYPVDSATYKVLFAVPVVGYLFSLISNPVGAVIFAVLLLSLVGVYLFLFHVHPPREKKKKEKQEGPDALMEFAELVRESPDMSRRALKERKNERKAEKQASKLKAKETTTASVEEKEDVNV
jgi:signal peptidase